MDYLQTIEILIEKTTEYNIPLHFAFINFHEAFDSIETWAILRTLDRAKQLNDLFG